MQAVTEMTSQSPPSEWINDSNSTQSSSDAEQHSSTESSMTPQEAGKTGSTSTNFAEKIQASLSAPSVSPISRKHVTARTVHPAISGRRLPEAGFSFDNSQSPRDSGLVELLAGDESGSLDGTEMSSTRLSAVQNG